MERNSNVNQTIKGKFVSNEVKACVSMTTEYILKQEDYQDAPFTWDDVENLTIDNSEKIEKLQEEIETLEEQAQEEVEESEGLLESEEISGFTHERNLEQIEEKYNSLKEKLQDQIEELENEQEEQQEVFEWWIVSDFLCRKLKNQGEVVIDSENIWGRCCTGQAILLDGVISNICEEMEILEGMANDWSKLNN